MILGNLYNKINIYLNFENKVIENFVKVSAKSIPAGAIVLDAGAGECRFKKYFSHCQYIAQDFCQGDKDWNYSGIDINSDLTKIPLADASVDYIVCTQVLEHVAEPFLVIKELCRLLKKNGKLFLTAPQGWGEHQQPHDYFRFTSFGLRYLFTKAGFRIESIKPNGGALHYLSHRLVLIENLNDVLPKKIYKIILFPITLALFLGVVFARLILVKFDFFDKKRKYTLNYSCVCVK